MYLTKNTKEKCVMARVMRQKEIHQENFSLKEYGSWAKAMLAGRKWIKEMLPKLPAKMSSKGRKTRRNNSGVVGVHWSPGIVKKMNGNVYECPRWIAKWPGCKFNGGISWMEKQFEHEGAFVLAVLSRQLETINRDTILSEFESIAGTKKYDEIVAKIQM
jgi:hypothetical protein